MSKTVGYYLTFFNEEFRHIWDLAGLGHPGKTTNILKTQSKHDQNAKIFCIIWKQYKCVQVNSRYGPARPHLLVIINFEWLLNTIYSLILHSRWMYHVLKCLGPEPEESGNCNWLGYLSLYDFELSGIF